MAITRVQGNSANSSGLVTSQAVTLPTGITNGNLVVAAVAVGNNAAPVTGPTGWTQVTLNQPGGTSATIETGIWYRVVGSGQAGQTSWTWTIPTSHSIYIGISEWHTTGSWPANPVDVFANGDTAGTPTTSTTISSGVTTNTSQAEELWIATLAYKGSAQTESNITTGWTRDLEATLALNNTMTMLYQIASSTGAASCSYNIGTSAYWAGAVVAFKDNPPASTPTLSTSPTSLFFNAVQGGTNPASQNDTLSETAGFATAWTSAITYGSGSGWLSISPTSGSLVAHGTRAIAVSAATGALAAGTYTATITFTGTTGGSVATINVTFTVKAPALSTAPATLTFSATATTFSPPTQTSTISETNGVGTNWTSSITYSGGASGWLSLSPGSGTLAASGHAAVTFTATLGILAAGTYTATATYTATTGGATSSVFVTFVILTPKSYKVTLAGQDITKHVDQMSLDIDDTLGQGSGAGSSGSTQGRAATIKFNTDLGPMNTALGAGQTIPLVGGPYLVRQGEIVVTDITGTIIWAGFATKYTDTTTSILGHTKQNFTAVEGIDYSTSLQRTIVNEVFSAVTDIYILQFILQKYAPWVNLQYLPTTPAYLFTAKNFRNQTVEQVIQTVAGITGYLVFVDYLKNLRYISPTTASSAPFNISDAADYITSFPAQVDEFLVDDNSAINRVFFYGGTKLTNDFWQDVSGMADGTNFVFVLAFYPSPLVEGGYGVTVGGVPYAVGTANGQAAKDQFISAGGTAQVLIDPGSRTATFDVGLAPTAGQKVLIGYRYNFPLSLMITDEVSHKFFGPVYLDGSIDDNTIFDVTTAIQRCKVLLSQQSFGLTTLKLTLWNHPGVQSGMIIQVKNTVRGINGSYLVQEVQIEPLGGGNFVYHLSLGAWSWGLIDFLLKVPTLATFQDDQTETQETVFIQQLLINVQVDDVWSTTPRTPPYYARSAPIGDGHDAFPGLSTISS